MKNLRTALAAAAAGCGSMKFIVGEAGVGKSRLAREVRDQAAQEGFTVLAGRAADEETKVPFRPLAEGLLAAFRAIGPPRVAALLPFRAALSRLVPEWREDDRTSAEASLLVVSEAVLRLLRVLAEGRGCLIVVEDLHRSDPETLAVLEYLADNLTSEPLLCVLTLRADEATPALSLARSLDARRVAQVVELGRLSQADTERMTATCLDVAAVPPELMAPVRTWADGLPFLIEELLVAWIASGALEDRPEGWVVRRPVGPMVPATFAEAIHRRLAAVESDGRSLMAAAAVLGQRFSWELVSTITGLDRATVMVALRRCLAAQLVTDDGLDGRGGFRLRHALTREAILAELLSPERAELSSRALRAVEAAHPGLPGSWCDLAADLAQASGDVEQAARLLLVAGRRALDQGALASAETVLEQARGLRPVDPMVQADLDEVLTEVYSLAGKCAPALESGRRLLLALGRQAAPTARQAELHLRLARALLNSGSWNAASEEVGEARGLIGEGETTMIARVDALAAHVALGQGRLDEANALATSALAVAERARLPEVACEALEVIGRRARLLDLAEAETAFDRARVVAEQHDLVVWRLRALQELASVDVATTRRLDRLNSARAIAEQAGAIANAAVLDLHIATVLAFRFEAHEGLAVARRCADVARSFDLGGLLLPMAQARQAVLPMALVRQAQCHAVLGNADEMEACIAEALALADGDQEVCAGAWGQCRALLSLLSEKRARASRELETAMGFVRDRHEALLWVFRGLWVLLATVEDREGEAARAELATSQLTALPHHRAFLGYAEAVAFGRMGLKDEAGEAMIVARGEMELAGGGFGIGHLALRLVAETAITDGWGDPVAWLQGPERFFELNGQHRVASACRSLLAKAGAPLPRRRVGRTAVPAALASLGVSGREHEVLMLVTKRLTNKEIADSLYLSARTVDKHVEHLLTKTGLHNRSQLSDLAVQLGAT